MYKVGSEMWVEWPPCCVVMNAIPEFDKSRGLKGLRFGIQLSQMSRMSGGFRRV